MLYLERETMRFYKIENGVRVYVSTVWEEHIGDVARR